MILRVTNPAAGNSPLIFDAVKRALVASGFERPPDLAVQHLFANCAHPCLGLWVALDSTGAVCGVIACSLPNNPLAQNPEVFINANWGPSAINEALVDAAVDFARAAGYNKMVAWNRTGRADEVFVRKHRRLGVGRHLGSMWEFTEAAG